MVTIRKKNHLICVNVFTTNNNNNNNNLFIYSALFNMLGDQNLLLKMGPLVYVAIRAMRRSSRLQVKGSTFSPFSVILSMGPGARFSKVAVTFRARNQIFKSKYKE